MSTGKDKNKQIQKGVFQMESNGEEVLSHVYSKTINPITM